MWDPSRSGTPWLALRFSISSVFLTLGMPFGIPFVMLSPWIKFSSQFLILTGSFHHGDNHGLHMLDRRWLHGGHRLTVTVGITGSVPTLLRAWTSNPWSCPNHFSPLSVKGIAELKKNEIPEILTLSHRRCQLMMLRLSVGWKSPALSI